jgi:hypothetical protein
MPQNALRRLLVILDCTVSARYLQSVQRMAHPAIEEVAKAGRLQAASDP